MSPSWKKRLSQQASLHLGPPVAYALFRGIAATLRHERVELCEDIWKGILEGKRYILAFFHGDSFVLARELFYHRQMGRFHLMASRSRDGEIMTRFLTRVGATVARGSSSRGGGRALLEMRDAMQPGDFAGMAVDGPRGPRHEVKDGVLQLARRTGLPILPLTGWVEKKWVAHSWDQMEIPKPFSASALVYGEPVIVPPEADQAEMARLRLMLQNRLQDMKKSQPKGP